MPNRAAIRAGWTRIVLSSCLGLGLLGLLWGCVVDPGIPSYATVYGAPGPVYGPGYPYDGDPYWDAWGGGYYGGFYGRGFGGTRLYRGGGHGAFRGGGGHGSAGGHRSR